MKCYLCEKHTQSDERITAWRDLAFRSFCEECYTVIRDDRAKLAYDGLQKGKA